MIDIQSMLDSLEKEWDAGCLSDGMYAEYATIIAERVAKEAVKQLVAEYQCGKIYVSDMQKRLEEILDKPEF